MSPDFILSNFDIATCGSDKLVLTCKGISRTEFILEKNSNQFYILELNTQPGMTPTSLVPEIAKYKGIEFDELINWILEDAGTNR